MTVKPSSKQLASGGVRRPPAAGRGRKKGELNRTTVAVKEALQMAFAGMGGVPALIEWAKGNPTEFYKLYARLLPRDIRLETDVNPAVRRALLALPD